MVLAAPRLSKATKNSSRCHSGAKLHFSSSVTAHIFTIKILTYSCDHWKCILNIKTQNIMSPKKKKKNLAHFSFFGPCALCHFLHHNRALEYCGNKKDNDFVTMGKKTYKISKLLSYVCFDLSLLWHLPNRDIASKIVKIVKFPKINCFAVFFSYNICSQGTHVFFILVYICLQSCTCLIRKLHPKPLKLSKYQKEIGLLYFLLLTYTLKVHMCSSLLFTSVHALA